MLIDAKEDESVINYLKDAGVIFNKNNHTIERNLF